MDHAILELRDTTKSYGKNTVFSDISLKLNPGKFYALLGRNGAGKSTLMRIIMRFEQMDKGQGWLFEESFDEDLQNLNQEIGYVAETLDYHLPVSIKKFFECYSGIYKRWNQALFDSNLSHLGLDQNKSLLELSRGQKMQLSLASVLAIQPKIILLDEVTSVLDSHAKKYFMNYLGAFTKEGGTVLMATNIISEVQNFADHALLIEDGKIMFNQPMSEVHKQFLKLRKLYHQENAIFNDKACIEVSINSDKSTSYLIPAIRMKEYSVPENFVDNRGITIEELFNYYTSGKKVK